MITAGQPLAPTQQSVGGSSFATLADICGLTYPTDMADQRRRRWREGDVIEFKISGQKWAYGLLLSDPLAQFFGPFDARLTPMDLAERQPAFAVWVHHDLLRDAYSRRIGNLDIKSDLRPTFFTSDMLSGEIRLRQHGGSKDWAGHLDDLDELEPAAVYDPEHLIARFDEIARFEESSFVSAARSRAREKWLRLRSN